VDIAPGHPTVKKCDFINVKICQAQEIEKPISTLPASFFDLVVFSLLLEYFPSKEARYKCCENAYQILKPGGILVIITPDSKHATANAPLMRQWRVSLATLGFWRVDYEKLHHLHCMVFRKACDPDFPKVWATRELPKLSSLQHFECPSQMMAIPQDNQKTSPEEDGSSTQKVEAQTDLFDELPNECSD
jgi:25S rRNA (adenine2142-N1)-methyltransferase